MQLKKPSAATAVCAAHHFGGFRLLAAGYMNEEVVAIIPQRHGHPAEDNEQSKELETVLCQLFFAGYNRITNIVLNEPLKIRPAMRGVFRVVGEPPII